MPVDKWFIFSGGLALAVIFALFRRTFLRPMDKPASSACLAFGFFFIIATLLSEVVIRAVFPAEAGGATSWQLSSGAGLPFGVGLGLVLAGTWSLLLGRRRMR